MARGNSGTRTAASKLEILVKILELERAQGHANTAVSGGLDSFLGASAEEFRPVLADVDRSAGTYSSRDGAARELMVSQILKSSGVSPANATQRPTPKVAAKPKATLAKAATTPPTQKASKKVDPPEALPLKTHIDDLKFIRKPTLANFRKMEVETLRDLLYLFPLRHIDYSNVKQIAYLEIDEEVSVIGKVISSTTKRIGRGATAVSINDGTGIVDATWFNQPYLASRFKPGTTLALSGKVGVYRDRAQFQNPEYESASGTSAEELIKGGNLLPVYPSTEGMYQRTLRIATNNALEVGLPSVVDPLPAEIRKNQNLFKLTQAIHGMHFPDSKEHYAEARRRLAWDELFINQVAVQTRRMQWREKDAAVSIPPSQGVMDHFRGLLPFNLTDGQESALTEIIGELKNTVPMARLLQGEVGSGKTVIALAAMLMAADAGYQAALMAPTEVLAEQHFLNIASMLTAGDVSIFNEGYVRSFEMPGFDEPLRIALLLGSIRQSEKAEIQRQISEGHIQLAIGTHALFQEDVEIPRLALAVVDEQHRFGVEQRSALQGKGIRPHLLAMSATPIPRSLALTLYGDLDISTLKELPGGRKSIKTRWLRSKSDREDGYQMIRDEVAAGRQAFVVCPFIEPSDQIEARAAATEYERLRLGELKGLRLGLLHGRMSLADKQEVMEQVHAREIDVLVATPVIEVGIDVPNATVMMVESAERFGLSQLHQLRGRVGRGEHASHCFVLTDGAGIEAQERLQIIERTHDGFELSEEDLRIRGPGDYLGTRQSGMPDLKVATIRDVELMQFAKVEAADLLEVDPQLQKRAHRPLASLVKTQLKKMTGTLS